MVILVYFMNETYTCSTDGKYILFYVHGCAAIGFKPMEEKDKRLIIIDAI